MLEHVFKAANPAAKVTLLEDVGQKAMAAKSVPTLQSNWLDEHLQANGTAELFAQKFLLHFTHEGRVGAIAVGRAVHPLIHGAVYRRVYGRVGVRACLIEFHRFSHGVRAAFNYASPRTLVIVGAGSPGCASIRWRVASTLLRNRKLLTHTLGFLTVFQLVRTGIVPLL